MATALFDFWFGPDTPGADDGTARVGHGRVRKPLGDNTSDAVLGLTPEDAALVTRLRQGDASALEELHRTYWVMLVRSATRLLGAVDAATDVVQDVLADLWVRRTEWSPHRSVATYLYRAVRNRALHVVRDAATEARWNSATPPRHWSPVRTVPTPGEELDAEDLNAYAHAVLATLPPRCREAFLLYAEERLEIPDIAAVMGISHGTATLQLKRAMATLRRALDARVRGEL